MKTHGLGLLLLMLTAPARAAFLDCIFFDGTDGESTSAPANWRGHLQANNCARKTVAPAANPPMELLHWSPTLARGAQSYANRCMWQHSGTAGLGENIYASFPPSSAETAAALSWLGEVQYYNYAANTCAAGHDCGHYTQMVWRDSEQIGCGITTCTTGSPFGSGNWTFIVCNYTPPGNFNNTRPY
jgi:hypothetical protein